MLDHGHEQKKAIWNSHCQVLCWPPWTICIWVSRELSYLNPLLHSGQGNVYFLCWFLWCFSFSFVNCFTPQRLQIKLSGGSVVSVLWIKLLLSLMLSPFMLFAIEKVSVCLTSIWVCPPWISMGWFGTPSMVSRLTSSCGTLASRLLWTCSSSPPATPVTPRSVASITRPSTCSLATTTCPV